MRVPARVPRQKPRTRVPASPSAASPYHPPVPVLARSLARSPGCASLFDVGHMGQLRWTGRDRAAFLESVVVADVAELKTGEAKLTLLTAASGGILDDSVITNHGDSIYMVVK